MADRSTLYFVDNGILTSRAFGRTARLNKSNERDAVGLSSGDVFQMWGNVSRNSGVVPPCRLYGPAFPHLIAEVDNFEVRISDHLLSGPS